MSAIGRVPESLIQDILARIDLVELVGKEVKLKKAGTNYSGLCPFHHEKTPSFTVSPTKQFYHCFGCGAHGDAIAFLMSKEGYPFIEALEILSQKAGITLPKREDSTPHEHLKPVYEVLKQAAIFYHQQWKSPDAKEAVTYLKKRGLTKEMVNHFAIGFAPEGWEHLCHHMQNKGVDMSLLEKAGLVSPSKKGGFYDRFRHRILFPIRDIKGRVLGFGGRVLDDSLPKYLNSPETPVFHKNEVLYGLFEARTLRSDRILLVEGYMDVVALAQNGIPALATMGTAVGENHFKHLFRYYPHVVLCFDGDEAGRKAAWKACLEALPLKNDDRQIDFVFLPDNHDPDSYIRKEGLKVFEQFIQKAMPYSEYFFESLQKQMPPTSLDNKARLVKTAQPLLQKLPQGVFRSMMLNKLRHIQGVPTQKTYGQKKPYHKKRLKSSLRPAEWVGVLLLRYPEWFTVIESPNRFLELNEPGVDLLQAVIHQIEQNLGSFAGEYYQKFVDAHPEWREALLAKPWDLLGVDALEEAFLGAIHRLEGLYEKVHQAISRKELVEKAKKGELSDLEKEMLKKFYAKGN